MPAGNNEGRQPHEKADISENDLAALQDLLERYQQYDSSGSDAIVGLYDAEARFTSIKSYEDGTKIPDEMPRGIFLTRDDEFPSQRPSQPVVYSPATFEQRGDTVQVAFSVKYGKGRHRPTPTRLLMAQRNGKWRVVAKEWEIFYL